MEASISLMLYLMFLRLNLDELKPMQSFDSFLFEPINHHLHTKISSLWDDNKGEQDLINQISRDLELESKGSAKHTLFAANMFEEEKRTTKLKDLPSHLEYAFLDNDQEFTVIISSLLSTQEKEVLLRVLTKHKSALAWKVVDIKDFMEVFMNDFSAFRNSFNSCLDNLSKMLASEFLEEQNPSYEPRFRVLFTESIF
nr:hypothetical protein [Tanacetum cinerariifolium]